MHIFAKVPAEHVDDLLTHGSNGSWHDFERLHILALQWDRFRYGDPFLSLDDSHKQVIHHCLAVVSQYIVIWELPRDD